MARRHLGMSPEEWDGLPWWQQKMYLDGYVWEGLIERSDDTSPDEPNVVSRSSYVNASGDKVTDTVTAQTLDLTPGAFAAFGIPETTME